MIMGTLAPAKPLAKRTSEGDSGVSGEFGNVNNLLHRLDSFVRFRLVADHSCFYFVNLYFQFFQYLLFSEPDC